jgi:hypothetical protein
MFSLGKVLGIVIAYSLQQILNSFNYYDAYRILLGFPGALALIQCLLIFFFVPDSPIEMVEKSDFLEAKNIV